MVNMIGFHHKEPAHTTPCGVSDEYYAAIIGQSEE